MNYKKILFWSLVSIGGAVGVYFAGRSIKNAIDKRVAEEEAKRQLEEANKLKQEAGNTDVVQPDTKANFPLKKGSRGDEVSRLQVVLKEKHSADLGKWGADGIWGDATQAAFTKAFPELNGEVKDEQMLSDIEKGQYKDITNTSSSNLIQQQIDKTVIYKITSLRSTAAITKTGVASFKISKQYSGSVYIGETTKYNWDNPLIYNKTSYLYIKSIDSYVPKNDVAFTKK
ncbi:MAG: hypothetical protein WCT77_11630 [Bacteroidota bacterium]